MLTRVGSEEFMLFLNTMVQLVTGFSRSRFLKGIFLNPAGPFLRAKLHSPLQGSAHISLCPARTHAYIHTPEGVDIVPETSLYASGQAEPPCDASVTFSAGSHRPGPSPRRGVLAPGEGVRYSIFCLDYTCLGLIMPGRARWSTGAGSGPRVACPKTKDSTEFAAQIYPVPEEMERALNPEPDTYFFCDLEQAYSEPLQKVHISCFACIK